MKKETIQDKKIKELLVDLNSNNVEDQINAVKALKQHGNETIIDSLLVVFIKNLRFFVVS